MKYLLITLSLFLCSCSTHYILPKTERDSLETMSIERALSIIQENLRKNDKSLGLCGGIGNLSVWEGESFIDLTDEVIFYKKVVNYGCGGGNVSCTLASKVSEFRFDEISTVVISKSWMPLCKGATEPEGTLHVSLLLPTYWYSHVHLNIREDKIDELMAAFLKVNSELEIKTNL
ncbi:hypothetical protein [Simiduia aestuariiviva]|uniref:Lipoprotein n=1 Tax=Simiduia aestuariiviva TaxID=1510459 RepID=A0A839UV32_9GAMM|nr:hypothetical protein [Simiduia aestuariiviva]MBB3169338.1 hypothetical protein [Simiduia aestuariiviva]